VVTTGVLNGKTVTAVSTGTWHSCAVADGAPYCWGYNFYGELGHGVRGGESSVPVAVTTSGALSGKTATAIATGTYHSCAIADAKSYCWGYNATGNLGAGSASTWITTPVATDPGGLMNGKTVTSLIVGENHSCALADGSTYCWGQNANGELGNGSTSTSSTPLRVTDSGVLSGKPQSILWSGQSNTFIGS
jgi:alpha-tubulin suppressor-like RCC1 family protein